MQRALRKNLQQASEYFPQDVVELRALRAQRTNTGRRWADRTAVDDLPHVNDYPDMHDIGDELLAAGFREPVMDTERLTLEYPDVMSLMRELKGLGAHNVASQRLHGLTGKSSLDKMLQAYEAFRREDRYPASFEVIYGTAFAPFEGQPVKTAEGDVATFSIDALRKRSTGTKSS